MFKLGKLLSGFLVELLGIGGLLWALGVVPAELGSTLPWPSSFTGSSSAVPAEASRVTPPAVDVDLGERARYTEQRLSYHARYLGEQARRRATRELDRLVATH